MIVGDRWQNENLVSIWSLRSLNYLLVIPATVNDRQRSYGNQASKANRQLHIRWQIRDGRIFVYVLPWTHIWRALYGFQIGYVGSQKQFQVNFVIKVEIICVREFNLQLKIELKKWTVATKNLVGEQPYYSLFQLSFLARYVFNSLLAFSSVFFSLRGIFSFSVRTRNPEVRQFFTKSLRQKWAANLAAGQNFLKRRNDKVHICLPSLKTVKPLIADIRYSTHLLADTFSMNGLI